MPQSSTDYEPIERTMGRLPPVEEQDWVLDGLAHLIAYMGETPMRRGRIWLPTADDFPDPWAGDLPSLRRLLDRLLDYAELGSLRVHVEPFEGDRTVDHVSLEGEANYRHHGAAAWFGGVQGDLVRFGCAERQLKEGGEGLVGVLCHEVAHAWRAVHGLQKWVRDEEERLTDLTTIYLGFGVFTTNNTYRFRTYSSERGARLYSGYSKSTAGYLSAETMSFAFAASVLARELTCWETWRLLRWLEPNQRGFTRAALRRLRPAEALWQRIGPEEPPDVDPIGRTT